MSAVDVLATLDNSIQVLAVVHGAQAAGVLRLVEVREAVAGLMLAAERLVDAANPEGDGWSEMVAALARVKGGKA